jgi:hypothetical protein
MPISGSAGSKTFSRTNGLHTGTTVWAQDDAATIGIRSDYHDTHDQDIATALNSMLQKDGGNTMSGDIPAGGNGFTGLGKLSSVAEITVASATTCNILGAAALFVVITGTTTITSLGTGTNTLKVVRFAGILTLTYNSTSLITPTGASITTAAGDMMIVTSDGSSNARVVAYQRADGTALGGTQGNAWAAEATVASATTCNILGAASYFVAISGTTTITSFGTGTNVIRFCRATGAFLITYNSTSLITPTGASITTAAGDTFIVISDGSSNARLYNYVRAASTPLYATTAAQQISGGARVTTYDNGTVTSGTLTPDPGNGPNQKYSNNGAHTLAPGSNYGAYYLDVTNASSAGAITTSGWTKVDGDSFDTTNTHKFKCVCTISEIGSTLTVKAMQ